MKPSRSPALSPKRRLESFAREYNRRIFLRVAGTASVGAPLFFNNLQSLSAAPNGKLAHACIGVGGMGWGDLQNYLKHTKTQVVALCDVDANTLANAAKAAPDARLYSDWRELLEKEGDRIDSVNVTVPDHMHFPIAYSAIQKGKHVYCQKPMCHDVAEVRALTEAAVKKGVITQLGTQMASGQHDRTAVNWLREGRVGKVTHAYLCSNRPGAVADYRLPGPRPIQSQPAPKELAWDLWLGTAPERSYAPSIYHPTKWRAWLDFGTGWSGDIGCHIFDAVWKGLKMQPPMSVQAEVQESWRNTPQRRADTWPQGDHITWVFPGSEMSGGKEWTLEWFDGEYYPPEEIRRLYSADLKEYPAESAMIVGTEGALLNPLGYPPQLLPEEKFKDVKRPELPARNHYDHFLDACLGGEKTESHFSQTGPMTEAILLGTVAVRVPGEKLDWDHMGMHVKDSIIANKLLKRSYREGWHVGPF
jgi:predicted dehydrogenase